MKLGTWPAAITPENPKAKNPLSGRRRVLRWGWNPYASVWLPLHLITEICLFIVIHWPYFSQWIKNVLYFVKEMESQEFKECIGPLVMSWLCFWLSCRIFVGYRWLVFLHNFEESAPSSPITFCSCILTVSNSSSPLLRKRVLLSIFVLITILYWAGNHDSTIPCNSADSFCWRSLTRLCNILKSSS